MRGKARPALPCSCVRYCNEGTNERKQQCGIGRRRVKTRLEVLQFCDSSNCCRCCCNHLEVRAVAWVLWEELEGEGWLRDGPALALLCCCPTMGTGGSSVRELRQRRTLSWSCRVISNRIVRDGDADRRSREDQEDDRALELLPGRQKRNKARDEWWFKRKKRLASRGGWI